MKKNENLKQSYWYDGETRHYRFSNPVLNRANRELGGISKQLEKGSDGVARILWYLTDWCGKGPTIDQFVSDVRLGRLLFRGSKNEYGLCSINLLIRRAVKRFNII